MVESREAALKAIERQTDTAALPLRTLIRERDVAAMDRILSYYGVHEKTLAEYDQRTG